MAQKKLLRFAKLKTFSNVLEYPADMAGEWKFFFKNENPIILELACGRGEYTIGLAALHPQQNFIGVDVKGNRMYIGAKKSTEENITNVAFLRTQIEKLSDYFALGEVDEIWITFPDPQLRESKAKKRLTHLRFLKLYQQILKPGGIIHLKTDSPDLYNFTKEVIVDNNLNLIQEMEDAYSMASIPEELKIKTHYEKMDIAGSKKIHYLKFDLANLTPHPTSIEREDEALEADTFEPLSAEYLLNRGYCCGNGCKNCPYDYKNVPEPRKNELLSARQKLS